MSYTNADGLRVLTNDDQGVVKTQGTAIDAMTQTLVVDINFASLGSSFGASNIDLLNPVIPAGSMILGADLVMTTGATSGGAATLTIGTYNSAGTAIVAAGFISAAALATVNTTGATTRCAGTHTTTAGYIASDAYVGAIFGTAAFTGGVGKLYIRYVKV